MKVTPLNPGLLGLPEQSSPARSSIFDLAIVVPTYNEIGNVPLLLERLEAALAGVRWQAIFVDDDSPDGTAVLLRRIAARDARVICLRRIARRGLAGAVIEGALVSSAPFLAVIDADLQHDETLLPEMLRILTAGDADLVVGSRYLPSGPNVVAGLGRRRRLGSRIATWLGRKALTLELTDPMSGFFMLRRELMDDVAPELSTSGFKVLFDIVACQRSTPRFVELPYEFQPRHAGASKLDEGVVAHYLGLLAAKVTGNVLSARAILFGAVGASGVIVNLAVLRLCLGLNFPEAQFLAAGAAMTSNYLINNAITYRDRRKSGWSLASGYLRFCALCSAGLAGNVAVSTLVNQHFGVWWAAGLAGAAVGAAWNYVSTALAVW